MTSLGDFRNDTNLNQTCCSTSCAGSLVVPPRMPPEFPTAGGQAGPCFRPNSHHRRTGGDRILRRPSPVAYRSCSDGSLPRCLLFKGSISSHEDETRPNGWFRGLGRKKLP